VYITVIIVRLLVCVCVCIYVYSDLAFNVTPFVPRSPYQTPPIMFSDQECVFQTMENIPFLKL
jgi:hypothetical protein